MFRVDMSVNLTICFTVTYGVFGFTTRKFNASAFRTICGVGIVQHLYSVYLRRVTLADLEE